MDDTTQATFTRLDAITTELDAVVLDEIRAVRASGAAPLGADALQTRARLENGIRDEAKAARKGGQGR